MANKKGSAWTTGEDVVLVKTMREAKNRPAGYRKAARLLGRTASACANRYGKERYKVISESVGKTTAPILKSSELTDVVPPTIVIKKPKNGKIIAEMQEELKTLSNTLSDRISEYHEVKGGQAERHAFCYYRSYVWRLQELVNKIK
jgi:hypothetical protein